MSAEVLVARLQAALDAEQHRAERMEHHDPDEGGYYACPAVRTEPLGDLPWGEDACTCGLAERRAAVLRMVQAHRDILAMYVEAKAQPVVREGREARLRGLGHASAMGRLTTLGLVVQVLARGYGLEDKP